MRRFADFLGLPAWSKEDLDEFLGLEHQEGHAVEYKGAAWLVEEGAGGPRIRRGRYRELREYAAGLSNVGGGLLFLGVPEKTRGIPGAPDGVPTEAWRSHNAAQVLGDVLASGIFPQLYPPPRVHLVPLRGKHERVVILIEFSPPLHRYYRVLHAGGFVPVRFVEGLLHAPPGLEAALAGDRGSPRPAIEFRPLTDEEMDEFLRDDQRSIPANPVVGAFPFMIANHGLGTLRDLRVGVVVSKSDARKPWIGLPRQKEELGLSGKLIAGVPRPLRAIFDVPDPSCLVLRADAGLAPMEDLLILAGVEFNRNPPPENAPAAKFGVWVSGEAAEPVFGAYALVANGSYPPFRVRSLGPPPFRLDGARRQGN